MDNDLSLCMIPDTPSPVFRGKTYNHRPATHINTCISSGEPLSHKSVTDVNGHGSRMYSWNVGAFHNKRQRVRNEKTDGSCSPVSEDRNSASYCSTYDATRLSLPGSPEFARERAEAVMRKQDKHNLSPFAKLKNGVSFCRNRTKKTNSNGFNNQAYSASAYGIDVAEPIKAKKRSVDTIAMQDADRVVIPKVRKIKPTFAWPSSSDSDDDEFSLLSKCKTTINTKKNRRKRSMAGYLKDVGVKRPKNTEKMVPLSATGINRGPIDYTEHTDEEVFDTVSFKRLKPSKTGARTSATGNLTHGPINYYSSDDEMQEISSREKTGKTCDRRTRDIGNLHRSPIDFNDSDDEMLADTGFFPDCSVAEGLSIQSPVATSTNNTANTQPLSLTRHALSPKLFYSSDSKDTLLGSNSPGLGRMVSKTQPPIISPVLSSDSHHMAGFVSPKRSLFRSKTKKSPALSRKMKPAKPNETTATFPASLTELSKTEEMTRDSPIRNKRDGSLGSNDNPIEIETLTPDTQQALMEIRQVQTDEDMARQMQEELDREFAMSLQHNTDSETHPSDVALCPHHHTGAHHTGATNLVEHPEYSPHWHLTSPVRHRAPRRRNNGGVRTRRERQDHPPDDHDAMLQLIRQTMQTMNTELGANGDNDVPFDQWFGHSPHRGRRRRGRRAGNVVDGFLFSPAVPGDDYENLMNLADILGDATEKGLSQSDLGRLPVVTYKKMDTQEVEECNICMNDYQDGDSQKVLPCFHSFHVTCIDKWIQKNATCPICRVEVKVNYP